MGWGNCECWNKFMEGRQKLGNGVLRRCVEPNLARKKKKWVQRQPKAPRCYEGCYGAPQHQVREPQCPAGFIEAPQCRKGASPRYDLCDRRFGHRNAESRAKFVRDPTLGFLKAFSSIPINRKARVNLYN
ncbi:hypothetical protein TIFTF001_007851 [Ficus carica]|uniref:Uncharacterized protein n=1 Tax=Ficus carica TaxID=3494 RepID=A0AA87ZSC6_FICCA|nr:hypothetical protein TIFTF001_007851 [Ficus carica]